MIKVHKSPRNFSFQALLMDNEREYGNEVLIQYSRSFMPHPFLGVHRARRTSQTSFFLFFIFNWVFIKYISIYTIVLWYEGNIVTDWKKAPHLAEMLFRVCKTNLEGVPDDPITYSWCHVLILQANLMDLMCKRQMILLSALFSWGRLITVVIIKISFADWDTAGI